MADFTKFGSKTPRVVVYKSESHKLHQAFMVKAGEKIYAGNPVAITTDGSIELLTSGNGANYIGIAITNNINPAYKESSSAGPVEVTVAVQGYMIINAVSEAALNAGPVEMGTGMVDSFTKFKAFTQAATGQVTRPVNFISLTKSTEAGELIQVLCK